MKPVVKRWLISLIIELVLVLWLLINSALQPTNAPMYIFPPAESVFAQQVFFYMILLLIPLVITPLGFLLSPLFIRFYLWASKRMKGVQLVGYAKFQENKRDIKYRYITRLIFGSLLCISVWNVLIQNSAFTFWVKPEFYDSMFNKETGAMYNFPMVPWYWLPIMITSLVFAMCHLILDSGLVYVKKIRGHPQFSDSERVGSLVWGLVKGYAGISAIITFTSLIFISDLWREGSMVAYPALAVVQVPFIIATIDLLRNWGRRLIYNAVKKHQPPEIIELDYKRTPVQDMKELYE